MPGPDDTKKPVQNFQPAQRHVGTGPDSDGDGLSDDFETNVFFSDPTAQDPDGDGLSDYAEYWLDTNPKNADSDGDGWLDGEDLAFGDPLRWNDGGAARTELRERARRQFDAEGSDKDKDFLRDHVESGERTKSDNPDSDGDGIGDGVEVQLRNSGVTTNQDSTPDDTTDLDAARERLGERRWESDKPPWSSSAEESVDGDVDSLVAGGPIESSGVEQPAFEQPAYEETAYAEESFTEPPYDDTMVADAGDSSSETSFDSWG
jgi:hypothetical protein